MSCTVKFDILVENRQLTIDKIRINWYDLFVREVKR